jgi:23S rRNA pseudouridine2605 synthase
MRLAKYLAHAGVASRRAAEVLIGEGRVAVGGSVVVDPARNVEQGERIEVDGRALKGAEARVVYVVNKPLGVISTAHDTHGRQTVVALVPASGLRLYPVGRLDADSSGLILLTNDGELANLLTHPRFQVPRTYLARVGGGPVGESELKALRTGVELEDGPAAPARVRVRRVPGGARGTRARAGRGARPAAGSQPSRRPASQELIELTVHEGRNRQVRRMCEAVGHPVLALERIAFGPLELGDLPSGAHRRLSREEVTRLRRASGGSSPG